MSGDAEVEVQFTADSSGMGNAVENAKGQLEEFGEGASEIGENLMALGEILATVFAVDKLEEFTKSMAEMGEQVEHTAAMTGLSVEAVQNFQYAVEATGGTTQSADLALVQLERHISEAAQGVGQSADAFQRLGVSQAELERGNLTEIMKTMADRMHDTADGANKVEAMYRAVGRSGAQLIPIFDAGSKAIDEMNQKFAETGGQISEEFSTQLTLMAQQLYLSENATRGVGNAVMGQLLPSINSAIIGITQMREEFSQTINSGGILADVIHGIGNVIDGTVAGVMTLTAAFRFLWDAAVGALTALGNAIEGVSQKHNQSFDDMSLTIKKYTADLKKMMDVSNGAATVGIGTGRGNEDNPFGKPKGGDQKDDLSQQRQIYAEQYDIKKENDELMVQSGQMSLEEELADLQAGLNEQQRLTDAAFDHDISEYTKGTAEYKKLVDQKMISDERFAIEHEKLTQQATAKDAQMWQGTINEIDKNMDGLVNSFLTGNQKMSLAFQKLASQMVVEFAQAVVKIMAENALLFVAQNQGWNQMSAALVKNLGQWTVVEKQKSAASMAGIAQRQVASDVANEDEEAGHAATASQTIMQDAAEAASNVYANVSQIPYVGWILAPPAAAAAFAAVAAYDSFAVGTDYVPSDMLANIHQGEMIIPAAQAASIRSGGAAPFTGAGLGDDSGNHVHFHVSAMDGKSVEQFFQKNGKMVANSLMAHIRNGGSRAALTRT